MTGALFEWARRHGVSPHALAELERITGLEQAAAAADYSSEAGAQSRLRLEAARAGILAWRNNVGAMQDPESGRVVRFGLANDSKRMNERVKSSDLIGIKPGGQFWCREVKRPGWKFTGSKRELAQLKFIELVLAQGGDAAFSTGALDN